MTVSFTPTATGTRTGDLTLTSDAPGSPHVVSLAGEGVLAPALGVAPTSLSFGGVRVGVTSAAQSVIVTNTGGGTLTVTSASASPAAFAVGAGCSTGLSAGQSCALGVTFTPSATGPASGTLAIETSAGPASVSLQGTGTAPAASATPSSLNFAATPVGTTTAPQTVTLQNTGTAPLAIASIVATGDFAQTTTCPSTLASGDSCTIGVTFTPTGQLLRAGTLTITHDAPGSPLVVNLSGTGTAAAAGDRRAPGSGLRRRARRPAQLPAVGHGHQYRRRNADDPDRDGDPAVQRLERRVRSPGCWRELRRERPLLAAGDGPGGGQPDDPDGHRPVRSRGAHRNGHGTGGVADAGEPHLRSCHRRHHDGSRRP